MKAVLISIKPQFCELIANEEKTIEIRKTQPTLCVPFKVYIYQTLPKYGDWNERDGRVIGEFICDYIIGHCESSNADIAEQRACVKREDIFKYSNGKEVFGWHISDLKIYDKPKELSEFTKYNRHCEYDNMPFLRPNDCNQCVGCRIEKPPQSWGYVEEQEA